MTKRTAEKFMMKILGENDIEDLLKRLDRLTQEEGVAAVRRSSKMCIISSNMRELLLMVRNRPAFFDCCVFQTLDQVERESTGIVRGGPSEFISGEFGVYLTLF